MAEGCILISAKTNPAGGTAGVKQYDLGCVAASTPGPYPPKAAATTTTTTGASTPATTTATTPTSGSSSTTTASAPAWDGDNAIVICSQMKGDFGDWNYFDKSVLAKAGLVDDKGNTLINHLQLGVQSDVFFYFFYGASTGSSNIITTNAYLADTDSSNNKKTDIWQFAVTTQNTGKLADSCQQFKD